MTRSQLPIPVSRAVVLKDNGSVVIAGGVDQAGRSTSGVFRMTPGGGVSRLGTLPSPTHDAAGALLHGRIFVFGGGTVNSTAAVQAVTSTSTGTMVGHLPRPRSDLSSAMYRNRAYLVGGYDGSVLDPQILETEDGISFRVVARLRVPVRYGAAVAVSGHLFVFGGQAANGDTAAIQEINLQTGRARLAGRLPIPLSHASALELHNYIYIVGGISGGSTSRQILSFDSVSGRVRAEGLLPKALSDTGTTTVGDTAYLVGGENAGTATTSLIRLRIHRPSSKPRAASRFPFDGKLLIADRGNNRLLLIDANKRVLWTYPSAKTPPPPGGFYFPDDAFFAAHGRKIIVNEEGNQVVIEIAYPSGRLLWQYGHPGIYGGLDGYLHEPDDAYILKNGEVVVADDQNCRVLFISPSGRILRQIGTTDLCTHQPPSALGSPNGDTPLTNGNILISEINGSWIDEYAPSGKLVWAVQLPISYPSDPQQVGSDRYLVAGYATPGGIYEFSRTGKILWSYRVLAGPGMLDHPSLAERLPNGLIAVSDDYRHRIVVIDPVKHAIVWQYGQTDNIGTGSGYLNTPDGFDLLSPGNQTPTHTATK